jgi:hypothetical protein
VLEKPSQSGIVGFYFIPGEHNPADILGKHWGYTQVRERLKSLLFGKGDTANIIIESSTSQAKGEQQCFGQITGEILVNTCIYSM